MARELAITYPGSGATLYAIVRRTSDEYAWNGSAFEVWADGNVGTYDVPLTDRGGDVYDADWPSAMAAGTYRAVFYLQAAGAPAITDDPVKSIVRYWNGTTAASESAATLSAYALCTLDQVKQDLELTGDSTYDTALTEDINQITAFVERATKGRRFKARDWRERRDGSRQSRLLTKQYPIITLTRLAYGWATAVQVRYSGSALRASIAVYNDYATATGGGVRLNTVSTAGAATSNNLTFADYPTTTLLAAAIGAVTGWTATATVNLPSHDLNVTAPGNPATRTVNLTYPDQVWDEQVIDFAAGMIEMQWQEFPTRADVVESRVPVRFPAGFQSLLIEYRAGYETIPDDVNMVARELVRKKYYERKTDPSITDITLGPYSAKFDRSDETYVHSRLSHYIDASRVIGNG